MSLGDELEHRFACLDLGSGLRHEPGRSFCVATQLGEVGAKDGDRRGHVHEQAGGRAGRRLERLIVGNR